MCRVRQVLAVVAVLLLGSTVQAQPAGHPPRGEAVESPGAGASGGMTPFQLAFASPMAMQMLPENWDVMGLRIDLVYGRNRNVGALDLGLVNQADGWEYGLEVGGLWNDVAGDLAGLQVAGLINTCGSDRACQGMQLAGANLAGVMDGLQIGVFNDAAGGMTGVQIGLVNISERPLAGVQIGLINLDESGTIPFMPIMNFGF